MASPMEHPIRSLHHVTATVDDAQQDLDFCVDALGLRLVKTTVNFDNHHVYHFYYGDEVGTPGTIWTTFPYKGWGVPVGTKGVGQVGVTSFSVPEGTLPFWRTRLEEHGIAVEDVPPRFGEPALAVADPSGLAIELVATRDARAPWTHGGVDEVNAVRGLHSVTMTVDTPAPTMALFRELLGCTVVDETDGRVRSPSAEAICRATASTSCTARRPTARATESARSTMSRSRCRARRSSGGCETS